MLSVCIQAGGESKRMGKNKAFADFLGQPLIQRVVDRIRIIANEILIIANRKDIFTFLNAPTYPDRVDNCGVLGGLYTGLFYAQYPYVASFGCDMPLINIKLIQMEFDFIVKSKADVVVPQSSKGFEPLHALYRRSTCLFPIENAIRNKNFQLTSWFDHVHVEVISPSEVHKVDPEEISFININTPEDLINAIKIVEKYPELRSFQ